MIVHAVNGIFGCVTAGFGPWGPGIFGMPGFFGGRESKGKYIARKIKLIATLGELIIVNKNVFRFP